MDTRVWRYRWRKKPGRPGPGGPQGEIEARLFGSIEDVPEGDGWGLNAAHAKVLAGLRHDPAVDGDLPEGVSTEQKSRREPEPEPESDE